MYSHLQLEPYNTLGQLSLVLYDVSVAAGSAQLGGQDIMAGTVIVEIQGTNYTGRCIYISINMVNTIFGRYQAYVQTRQVV